VRRTSAARPPYITLARIPRCRAGVRLATEPRPAKNKQRPIGDIYKTRRRGRGGLTLSVFGVSTVADRFGKPSGPGEEERRPRRARPYPVFRRALERRNLVVAETTAKEIGRISLTEALELTLLIARKDPRRHPRVAARWLLRYLEERDGVTIAEAAMAAACLVALGGDRHEEAAQMLRAMADRAPLFHGRSER
jgi:hypothetical protein